MISDSHEDMRQELLEYHFGCHEDPDSVTRRLKEDPALRELYDDVKSCASVLEEAASLPVPDLELGVSRGSEARDASSPGSRFRLTFSRVLIAASILVAVVLAGTSIVWWERGSRISDIENRGLRLVVSCPPGTPDAAPLRCRIETWNHAGEAKPALVTWKALDTNGKTLVAGSTASEGALDLDIPARMAGLHRLEFLAEQGASRSQTTIYPRVVAAPPLVHLSTDKPAYRPGETLRVRALILNRQTLEPLEGQFRFRIADPKGTAVRQFTKAPALGIVDWHWVVPGNLAGGTYAFELRDRENKFSAERQEFLVRRYQPPRLAKRVDLDRKTYAPGSAGSAEVFVERVEGGVAAEARIEASLVIDGETVWSKKAQLDDDGRAIFGFKVPDHVKRGDARFVACVTDGGITETHLEPFVVPTGIVKAVFYPEGGDLVAGVSNRIYLEVVDALDRPCSARARILNESGRVVASIETQHQGRAQFSFTPEEKTKYRLVFDEPKAEDAPLPEVLARGVVLQSIRPVTSPGENLELRVNTPDEGPWVVGVFLRGLLVGQDTFKGSGSQDVTVTLPPTAAGVLRVTVFNHQLRPVAERLVHRESGRRISVEVEPARVRVAPGESQEVKVVARDEEGRPVKALLGVSVSDRSVRDMVGKTRVGLADRTWLVGDVRDLEEVEEFLAQDDQSRRNVDLLLGTRGWRRFGWLDCEEFLEKHGDDARRILVREGGGQPPIVSDRSDETLALLPAARSDTQAAKRTFRDLLIVGGLLIAALLIARLIWKATERLAPRVPAMRPLAVLATGLALVAVIASLDDLGAPMDRLAAKQLWAGNDATEAALPRDEAAFVAADRTFIATQGATPDALLALRALFDEVQPGHAVFFNRFGEVGGADNRVDRLRLLDGDVHGNAAVGLVVVGGLHFWNVDAGEQVMLPRAVREQEAKGLLHRVFVRVFAYKHQPGGARRDFTETLYWHPALATGADGTASFKFDVSDSVTSWSIDVDAHGSSRVGQAHASFESRIPFRLEASLPAEATQGDELNIPVAVVCEDDTQQTATLEVKTEGPVASALNRPIVVPLTQGRGRAVIPMRITAGDGIASVTVTGTAGAWKDSFVRKLRLVPRGFPRHVAKSGVLTESADFEVALPEDLLAGSLKARLKLYPSPLATMLDGMEGMIRSPGGCFEQASSSNYPNVMALNYLRATGADAPALAKKARLQLERGYKLLAGYECADRGYEWFGQSPAHEALTAYGLVEFHDMSKVYAVDGDMVKRTREWVYARRDGNGGYRRNPRALDSFGRAPEAVNNAYVTWALVETGQDPASLAAELDRLEVRAAESDDPYEVAIATCALERAGRKAPARNGRNRLKGFQQENGSLTGTTTSITSSRGVNLALETTSFAILAWLADPQDIAPVIASTKFLMENRSHDGRFGSTQATIMALKALTAYAERQRRDVKAGEITLLINDRKVASVRIGDGEQSVVLFDDFARHLQPGPNTIHLLESADNQLPYSFSLEYFAEQPADDPGCAVAIRTTLGRRVINEGDTVPLAVAVANVTDEGVPMTLAAVGLPAGLEVTTQVLDSLKEAGRFAFYELRGRDVVLYWRDLGPNSKREVTIDLIAKTPGTSTGAASRSWLYYTNDQKVWAQPLTVTVKPQK